MSANNKIGRQSPKSNKAYGLGVYHKTRKCRSCKGRIEKSRWWNCLECKPELESVQEDWIFEDIRQVRFVA